VTTPAGQPLLLAAVIVAAIAAFLAFATIYGA
jgi:hypothetical protein